MGFLNLKTGKSAFKRECSKDPKGFFRRNSFETSEEWLCHNSLRTEVNKEVWTHLLIFAILAYGFSRGLRVNTKPMPKALLFTRHKRPAGPADMFSWLKLRCKKQFTGVYCLWYSSTILSNLTGRYELGHRFSRIRIYFRFSKIRADLVRPLANNAKKRPPLRESYSLAESSQFLPLGSTIMCPPWEYNS